jgi:hypothetical protein
MRTDGLATPALMQQIGDLLAGAGRSGEAKRVYSEIVEFSPEDPAARRLLGDIYLRHGWYESAYRQYKTLTEDRRSDALGLLRQAAAASGTGRVDEALRLERRVAAGEGEPGPKDPRRWARLWSAARIARLMLSASGGEKGLRRSMERSLRRLQVVSRDEVLVVVTWEDLSVPLGLEVEAGGKALSWADRVPAGAAGLLAVRTRTAGLQLGRLAARIRRAAGAEARSVPIQLTVIRWDGKQMRVSNDKGKVEQGPLQLSVRVP